MTPKDYIWLILHAGELSLFPEYVSFWWSLIIFFHYILIFFISFADFGNFLTSEGSAWSNMLELFLIIIFLEAASKYSFPQIDNFVFINPALRSSFRLWIGAFTSFLLLAWLTPSTFNMGPVSSFAFGPNPKIAPSWSLKPAKRRRVVRRSWVTWLQENTLF